MALVRNTIVPVFAIVAVGFVLAGRRSLHVASLADLSLFVASPALVFSALSGVRLETATLSVLVGGTLFVGAGTALLALLYLGRGLGRRRGLLLPAIFWNAGNMALPCARLAFGPDGLAAASVVFVTMASLTFLFGIWIAKGENGLAEVLRLPLIYAAAGGVGMALAEVSLPRLVMEPIEMIGAMAIPLMLINLGAQLRTLVVGDVRRAAVAVGIRMLGGPLLAVLFVALLDVRGVARQVLLLHSVMPPAVINVVLAQRYDTEPTLVASAIALGTCLAVVAIPAVLLLVS
jgi:predicted permease